MKRLGPVAAPRSLHANCSGHCSRMVYSSVRPVRTGRSACASLMCSCTPSQASPFHFDADGVKYAAVNTTPGRFFAFISRASHTASRNGAPMISNGQAVPRPSETFVPSKRHVPG